MTFADWLIMVERSGVPVSGIDPNWLQHQYQIQQQPALVAHMIRAGQAPRMNAQPIGFNGAKRSGCSSPMFSVIVGIVGFIAIIGGILYGISYAAKNGIGGVKPVDQSSTISDIPQVSEKTLRDKGLDPKISYPYWPLVYDLTGMKADKETISGKVTNYGDKAVNTVLIQFGLFTAAHDKVGTAQDQIASLGPGETWSYQASVKGVNYEDCRLDSITFK
jgi:hypothetical protein